MRKHQQLGYLLILVLVCGSVALAATQWTLQPKESKLTFVGTQARAEFEGTFERFTADIKFDPQDLAGSRFDVKIDTASVNTRDSERDDTLKSDDLFAVKQFPAAHYVAERFAAKGGKYTATGKLTLRNVTRDVPIEFTFEKQGRQRLAQRLGPAEAAGLRRRPGRLEGHLGGVERSESQLRVAAETVGRALARQRQSG